MKSWWQEALQMQIASFNAHKKAWKVALVDADLFASWKMINEEDIG